MKKTSLIILLGTFGTIIIAAPTFAATSISFTPNNVNVRPGQTFTLVIGINPQGVKNYTVKKELRYPADLLEIKSFTFANGWLPLSQPGYDLTDNLNGVSIKTAGYPGGISSSTAFGTVSFLAKKTGKGTIALNSNSFALDANNKNSIAGTSVQTTVTITAQLAIVPTAPQAPMPEPEEEKPIIQTEQEAPETAKEPAAPKSLLAQISNFATLKIEVGTIVTVIIIILAGYAIYALIKRTRHKNAKKQQ